MPANSPTATNDPDPAAEAAAGLEVPLCGIIAVDAERRVVAIDPDVEVLLGVGARELIGQPLRQLPDSLAGRLAEVLDGDEPLHEEALTFSRPDGTTRVMALSARALVTGNGRLAVATLLDVTALRELEANTHRLERLASIGTLSASMAHEIKNALVAVRTLTDILIRKNQDMELAGLAGREVTPIDSIVSQMLRFGGLGRPTFSPLRVNEVVSHACRLIQHQIEGKRIGLRQDLHAAPDRVNGDTYQLHQALLNLFFNAIDAMPEGGELTVATEFISLLPTPNGEKLGRQACVGLTVRDTGTRIAPENVAGMLQTFFSTN